MKNKILAMTLVSALAVGSVATTSFAETTTQTNQNVQMKEKFERPANEIFGKITAISENSVTISLAEMKTPENGGKKFGNPPEKPEKDGKGVPPEKSQQDGNRPERKELTNAEIAEMKKKFEENVTLTGESKTIDISNANFNDFGRGPKDGKQPDKQADSSTNNSSNDNKKQELSYKDYKVGDYISIELTAENSNVAKSVRGAGMMRGMEPPKDDNKN